MRRKWKPSLLLLVVLAVVSAGGFAVQRLLTEAWSMASVPTAVWVTAASLVAVGALTSVFDGEEFEAFIVWVAVDALLHSFYWLGLVWTSVMVVGAIMVTTTLASIAATPRVRRVRSAMRVRSDGEGRLRGELAPLSDMTRLRIGRLPMRMADHRTPALVAASTSKAGLRQRTVALDAPDKARTTCSRCFFRRPVDLWPTGPCPACEAEADSNQDDGNVREAPLPARFPLHGAEN
ncbi:MAG: hypothetical protein RLZZ450_832 [Pseudomonadota bacterium]|jgi:hypothetical protein